MRGYHFLFALTFTGVVFLAGCNTDRLHARRAPRGAPVESPRSGPTSDAATGLHVVADQEVDLVESVVSSRNTYERNLAQLQQFYAARGYAEKETWARFEQDGFRSVKKFRYLMGSEVPAAALRPESSITAADALYDKGRQLMRDGGHGVPILYREDLMVQASDVFRELIEKYPSSDKIDDAAFMLGEIHKEYLKEQESIAVTWYERAWTWDPKTPHAARFQAAVVYDYRLHDRDRALELYRAVVEQETDNRSNLRWANRRIRQLTDGSRSAPPVARVVRERDPS